MKIKSVCRDKAVALKDKTVKFVPVTDQADDDWNCECMDCGVEIPPGDSHCNECFDKES